MQSQGQGTGSRAMRNGSTSCTATPGGGTQPCPCGTAITGVNVSADGAAFSLPIHGQINKSAQTALHAGMYTDMLQVTVERLRELTAPERAASEALRGLCLWGLRAHARRSRHHGGEPTQ